VNHRLDTSDTDKSIPAIGQLIYGEDKGIVETVLKKSSLILKSSSSTGSLTTSLAENIANVLLI
jgi:hypothetical protein